jgi:hypothetical protein
MIAATVTVTPADSLGVAASTTAVAPRASGLIVAAAATSVTLIYSDSDLDSTMPLHLNLAQWQTY